MMAALCSATAFKSRCRSNLRRAAKHGLLIGFASWMCAGSAIAKDFGTHGPVWEVKEPSLIDTIKTRLHEMTTSGEMDKLKSEMQARTRAYANRPTPVAGLIRATEPREYSVDLSITLERDLRDHRGVVFARRGTVVNPLHYSRFNQRIVVFDGDDPTQVAFALREGNELDTLLVLINGAPLELMRQHRRRFYFDQHGQITSAFGLTKVPSEILRGKDAMWVREIVLKEEAQ